jgi:hypothetical protein
MIESEQPTSSAGAFLFGTWKMVSWTREVVGSGEKSNTFGENPVGYINYSADGRVMVIIVKNNRKGPSGLISTDSEKVELFDGLLAYGGTYTVDGENVIHHIDISWNHSWTGTDQVRFYKLDGKTLTYSAAPMKSPIDGQETAFTVIWEKIEP